MLDEGNFQQVSRNTTPGNNLFANWAPSNSLNWIFTNECWFNHFLLLFFRKTTTLQLVIYLDYLDLFKILSENKKETEKNMGPVFFPYVVISSFG